MRRKNARAPTRIQSGGIESSAGPVDQFEVRHVGPSTRPIACSSGSSIDELSVLLRGEEVEAIAPDKTSINSMCAADHHFPEERIPPPSKFHVVPSLRIGFVSISNRRLSPRSAPAPLPRRIQTTAAAAFLAMAGTCPRKIADRRRARRRHGPAPVQPRHQARARTAPAGPPTSTPAAFIDSTCPVELTLHGRRNLRLRGDRHGPALVQLRFLLRRPSPISVTRTSFRHALTYADTWASTTSRLLHPNQEPHLVDVRRVRTTCVEARRTF